MLSQLDRDNAESPMSAVRDAPPVNGVAGSCRHNLPSLREPGSQELTNTAISGLMGADQ